MTIRNLEISSSGKSLPKSPTGIHGLDEITAGGLPKGRPTLVCGGAGCGKTLLALEFIIRGAVHFDEPGVFMAFEETEEELTMNVASLGFDLDRLVRQKKIFLDYVRIEPGEIDEAGEYDLEGIFIRLDSAIKSIGAKRVAIDTVESLFSGLSNVQILRAELRRLLGWLKKRDVTSVITAERGDGTLTRHSLEEYVSDCVIFLDHRVTHQTATRRLRIMKYRGSAHGTNEYPFLIDDQGISVLPVTTLGLEHKVSTKRISSGVGALDDMLEGKGYYRGSSVLVSGTAGTGKTSLAAHLAAASCSRGERVLYACYEESPAQITRNMLSIGINLETWVKRGLLRFQASRPTMYGLEMHLAVAHRIIDEFKPDVVVVDPINTFGVGENDAEVKSMLIRLADFLKSRNVTAFFTSLTSGGASLEHTDIAISSLIDTWILLRDIESSGERNRGLYILKSRGMANSNQIREFVLTSHGVELRRPYIGAGGVLTGSARLAQEAAESAQGLNRVDEIERNKRELERKRHAMENQIADIRTTFELEEAEALKVFGTQQAKIDRLELDRRDMAKSRKLKVNRWKEKRRRN